jgi:hypothetical protein
MTSIYTLTSQGAPANDNLRSDGSSTERHPRESATSSSSIPVRAESELKLSVRNPLYSRGGIIRDRLGQGCVIWSHRYEENRNILLHISLFSRVCAFIIIYIDFFVFQCCFFLFARATIYRGEERNICFAAQEVPNVENCTGCRGGRKKDNR